MFALIQLKNIEDNAGIDQKIKDYEYIGVFESIVEIEKKYKNYYPHKYRLKDNGWCYFVRIPSNFNKDIDSHKLADKIIIDLQFESDEFHDYQTGKTYNRVSDDIIKNVLRDIKLNIVL
jgi:hypothetical protein